jgi:hypothetical protein
MVDKDFPAPDELADEDDQLSWDHERDGRMADHSADDDAVKVTEYKGDDDAPSA